MSSISVAKFGGSSMGNAEAMMRVVEICTKTNPTFIVVSAVSGVTNQLEKLMAENADKKTIVKSIRKQHEKLCKELRIDLPKLTKEFLDELEQVTEIKHSNPQVYDHIYSFGELLSSSIFIDVLKKSMPAKFADARNLIKTDGTHTMATPDYKETKKAFSNILPFKETIVTQGFIASDQSGNTTTLGRGGSDFSAAIIAQAIEADSLTIWTDAPGVYSADPRIVKDAKVIPEMTYSELAEYAYAGAHIIYPPTVKPIYSSKIPLTIKSTFNPTENGTRVSDKATSKSQIHGVSSKKNQILLTITTPEMSAPYGYLETIFGLFADHKISVDQVITSETAVSISLKSKIRQHKDLIQDLQKLGDLKIERNVSIISLVGNNVAKSNAMNQQILSAISDVEIVGMNQGASSNSLCILVKDEDADKCVKQIHKKVIV